jgi:ribulose-phosphate 3-epimerase
MKIICPTVLADDKAGYALQIKKITGLSKRIQIDLMDGIFAPTKSVALDEIWWPPVLQPDIHLMYQEPEKYLEKLLYLKPSMVIVHAEADLNHMKFAALLHRGGIRAGLAVLSETTIKSVENILSSFDHLLIFSGDLGKFGGKADLENLNKAEEARQHHPEVEIGWDGGVNDGNAAQLAAGGVDVLNVGGYIQKSDDPGQAYEKLKKEIEKL